MTRRWGAWWGAALVLLFATLEVAGPVLAQAPTAEQPDGFHERPLQVAVLVDRAATPSPEAERLVRETLAADTGLPVAPLHRLAEAGVRPQIVLTVTFSRGGDVQVMYWDAVGHADGLTAPAPGGRGAPLVAASLSTALVRRNLPRLQATLADRAPARPPHPTGLAISSLTARELREAAKHRQLPRSGMLTIADF